VIELFPRSSGQQVEVLAAVQAEDRFSPGGRPWVMTNMIATSDGATAIGGLSGPLGGAADGEVFTALRSVADAIVAGAATVRQERYRPPRVSERSRAQRQERGQAPRPLVVVISASLALDPGLPLFADAGYRPMIATIEDAPADRRRALSAVAEVIDAGTGQVDLGRLVKVLGDRGMRTILSEGGPALNGQLIAAELVDEWNLTISPILAGGASKRAALGPEIPHPTTSMTLSRVWQHDDLLFCRWVRAAKEVRR
jgi:riboflavin biosynthesis pyrimidine reductase